MMNLGAPNYPGVCVSDTLLLKESGHPRQAMERLCHSLVRGDLGCWRCHKPHAG